MVGLIFFKIVHHCWWLLVHQEKNTWDICSKQATSAPLLLEFQTFKSSEVKIGGYSKEKNFDLSFVTIVAGISKHSNHRRLKIDGSGKQKDFHLSYVMYCGFQMLLNHLVIKFSIMDPVILSDFNKKITIYVQLCPKNCKICTLLSQKAQ